MENWYVPITLLPSVGFFVVATTSVANSLSGEIARLIELEKDKNMEIVSQKIQQLRLVNISLVLWYVSAIFFAIAGLLAGLNFNFMLNMKVFLEVLICIGIGTVIIGLGALIKYSLRAVRIKEEQFKNM